MEDSVLIELLNKSTDRISALEDENQKLKNDNKIHKENMERLFESRDAHAISIDKQQTAQRLFEIKVQERQDRMIKAMDACIEFHNSQVENLIEWKDAIQDAVEEVHEFHKTNMSNIYDKISKLEHYQEADPNGELNDIRTELVELPEIIEFKKCSKWDFLRTLFRY